MAVKRITIDNSVPQSPAYVYINSATIADTVCLETEQYGVMINVDLDSNGQVVGVEII